MNLLQEVTAAVREADEQFQSSGGSSRHWVDEYFLPALKKRGLEVRPSGGIIEPECACFGRAYHHPTCPRFEKKEA